MALALTVEQAGVHASTPLRFASTRLWLTKPLLLLAFRMLSDETRAVVRTTQVVTMLRGSQAANALAESAEAIVNVRIAVGSSVADPVEHVRRAIRDPRVTIEARKANEPSPVSPTTGEAWEPLSETIRAGYPGVIVAPYVMLAASDSRHYARISDHVYRFSPFEMSAWERATLHARIERIRVETFVRGIAFYDRLIARL